MPSVLIVASHNPTGVSGASLDIEVCSTLNIHPSVVYASISSQSLTTCEEIYPVRSNFLFAQLNALFSSFAFSVVKIGMLYSSTLWTPLMNFLQKKNIKYIIVDPVISTTSGVSLVADSISFFFQSLCSNASSIDLLIPNQEEAEKLLKTADIFPEEMCKKLHQLGFQNVLLTGGHYQMESDLLLRDYFCNGKKIQTYTFVKILDNLRGTGCTLSTAIACFLTKGYSLEISIGLAKKFLLDFLKNKKRQLNLISL